MVWDTSIWWVLLAAMAYFAVGSLWYSPVLFIKPWMKAQGITGDGPRDGFVKALGLSFLLTVLLCVIEAYFVHVTKSHTTLNGAYLGAKLWLGFAATTALINSLYEQRPLKLYVIDQGYHLIGMVVAGAILVH
ncbi:DUF1761 domain-containing protein [Candidatus Saccharibacteria bacterium]|nr:DUF1761 domain-containing protein [Candidatus Saccharibacteria bacterium]